MINTTTYSQLDPRWADKYIGKTRQKIRDYGCTVTSLCNLVNSQGYSETPETFNRKMSENNSQGYLKYTANGKTVYTALVIWSVVTKLWPKVKFVKRVRNYNNIEVSFYVYAKKVPVMVEVYNAQSPTRRHWVLFVGGRKLIDPLGGVIRPTNSFPLTGYAIYDK